MSSKIYQFYAKSTSEIFLFMLIKLEIKKNCYNLENDFYTFSTIKNLLVRILPHTAVNEPSGFKFKTSKLFLQNILICTMQSSELLSQLLGNAI